MSAVLQEVLVAVLVTACALFSTWRLLSARLRLRCLDALAAVPGARTARWADGGAAAPACRGSAPAAVAARSTSTPGASLPESNIWCTSPLTMRSW